SDVEAVHLLWRDQHGASNSADLHVKVLNVPPRLSDVRATSATSHSGRATLTGKLFDPGVRDTFTLLVNWGDGRITTEHLRAGATRFELTHQYARRGNYKISLTLLDDDGGAASASIQLKIQKASHGHGHDHHGRKEHDD